MIDMQLKISQSCRLVMTYEPYPNPDIVFKFAATLKGPSTLLYKLPDDMRDLFNANMENRLFFSVLIGDQSQIDELYTRWFPEKVK
jgi:hypothetical protein